MLLRVSQHRGSKHLRTLCHRRRSVLLGRLGALERWLLDSRDVLGVPPRLRSAPVCPHHLDGLNRRLDVMCDTLYVTSTYSQYVQQCEGFLMGSWVECAYHIEATTSVEAAAGELVGEQTSGTFIKVPGENSEITERFGGRVLKIEPLGQVQPALDSRFDTGTAEAALIHVAYPTVNFGGDLTTLLTTVAGNLFELGHLRACRLVSIELPKEFYAQHAGPAFGVAGTRKAVSVTDGPLIGTIVKPNIGLDEDSFRSTLRTLLDAGVDFIKDDEVNADPSHLPFERRVQIVYEETDRSADQYGRKIPYAFNLAGPLGDLERKYELVLESGGQSVMLPVFHQGIAALEYLRSFGGALQIHAHRAGFAAITRSPSLGIDFKVWHKLLQLAGADHIHVSGLKSKFFETDDEVAENIKTVLAGVAQDFEPSLPVLSSGQTVFAAHPTLERINSTDVMMLAGGGILGHPLGAEAGVRSLRQSWSAASAGESLSEFGEHMAATGDYAVANAVENFGQTS